MHQGLMHALKKQGPDQAVRAFFMVL